MSNLKYVFEKHKNAILIGASLIGLGAVGLGVYSLVKSNKPVETPNDVTYEDKNIKKADYILGGDKKGNIDLISTKTNSVVESITLPKSTNTLYARDTDLEQIMAYSNGTYYEISEKDGKLEQNKIFTYADKIEGIESFKFSDKYIIALTKDGFIVSSLDKKETHIQDLYKDPVETEETIRLNIKIEKKMNPKLKYEVNSYAISENNLIYGYGDLIIAINLDTNEEKLIQIGDTTEALFVMKDNVIAFNKFGNGANNSTLLKLKPTNLNIDKAHKHENKNVFALTPDSDDETIPFVDRIDKNTMTLESHYNLNIDETKNNKKRTPLISPQDEKSEVYNPDNTVSTKGYVYSNLKGELNIYDLRAEANDIVVSTNKDFFMPILK